MNGIPEKYCPRCVGTGLIYDKPCPCLRRDTPIAKPRKFGRYDITNFNLIAAKVTGF